MTLTTTTRSGAGRGATLWRAVYAYSGGLRDVADDAVAEAFARVMARGSLG